MWSSQCKFSTNSNIFIIPNFIEFFCGNVCLKIKKDINEN